jgi:hypothetical protein
MADQGVNNVSKVNPSIPSSLNTQIPVLYQFKNRFDSINPVLYKLLIRRDNNSYFYYQLNIREFNLYDLVIVSYYLNNATVIYF